MHIERKKQEQAAMSRVWEIYNHPLFRKCVQKNEEYEKERIYCQHGVDHLLAVARLAYIFVMEREYSISKEMIYATALLHDAGRWEQYENGTPHDLAGARIADEILMDCGFDQKSRDMVTAAILSHRGDGAFATSGCDSLCMLQEVLYDADKMSRDCYACKSEPTCNWASEKKNLSIMW